MTFPYCTDSIQNQLFFGQGVMVGEVTSSSAILQTRLTRSDTLENGDVPGKDGWIHFQWQLASENAPLQASPWIRASESTDHIVKYQLHHLEANERYRYWALSTNDTSESASIKSIVGVFRTCPGAAIRASTSLVVVTGMNYYFFHYGRYDQSTAYQGRDKYLGFPALQSIKQKKPDYFIGTGDNVYFDHPAQKNFERAVSRGDNPQPGLFGGREVLDEAGMRRKYHTQFVQPRFKQLFAKVGTYWEKDDHDYRVNDGDPFTDFPISHELGIKNFREQLPVVDIEDKTSKTYRTHRITRDVQCWFLEGRDYRDANDAEDGPEKSLWGLEQIKMVEKFAFGQRCQV